MTHSVLLDNVTHKDLRVITQRGAAWGDGVMSTVAFPVEFRNLQAHYPIVFQKTADGISFQPVPCSASRRAKTSSSGLPAGTPTTSPWPSSACPS
jgi:hypothetical protein